MARLALSVAGGIIGAVLLPGIGAGFGFALGSLIGGVIGQLAFPGKGTHVYGPRLNDMQVSSSAPGTVIPIIYGSMRLGGQIIWSNGIQEVATTKKQSAKGGPTTTQTTYTYFCSFAAAFCQGSATITRVWGDAKLIFDVTGRGQVAKNINVFPTRYHGDEDQLPDPFIASISGANNTPAYRGTCYAVWEKFPLANFGNRIPNIRAEVTSDVSAKYIMDRVPWDFPLGGSVYPYSVVTDPQGLTAFQFAVSSTTPYIQRVDLTTNTVVASGTIDMSPLPGWGAMGDLPFGTSGITTVDAQGFLWGYARVNGVFSIVKLDPWTFKAVLAVDITSTVLLSLQNITTYVAPDGSSLIVGFGGNALGAGASAGTYAMFTVRPDTGEITGQYYGFIPSQRFVGETFALATVRQTYPVLDFDGNAYFIWDGGHVGVGSTGDWYITKINMTGGVTHFPTYGPVYVDVTTFSYTPDSTVGVGTVLFWNPPDNTLIVMTNVGAYLKIDANTGTILDSLGSDSNPQFNVTTASDWQHQDISGVWLSYGSVSPGSSANTVQYAFKGRTQNGVFWSPSLMSDNSAKNAQVISAVDFSKVSEYDINNFPDKPFFTGDPVWIIGALGSQSTYVYDPLNNSLITNTTENPAAGYPTTFPTKFALYRAYFDRHQTGGQTADAIVNDLCERAGVAITDVDTAAIAGLSVIGYPVTHIASGKDLINTLGQALFFEARESDFKLQFVPRGQTATLTVPESDLGLAEDNAKLVETVGQEQDVPKDVEVIYMDQAQDYQQNKQHRVRHSKTKTTLNRTSVSLPIVMDSSAAAQLTDRILWTAEAERRHYKLNLWKAYYALLDPCDVINLNYNGAQLTGRISGATVGQNLASALEIVSEDSSNYITNAAGNDSSGFVPQTISNLATTLLWMLDIPYLQDQDADAAGNIGFYFGMSPNQNGASWAAGVLYRSSDRAEFSQVDASATRLAHGTAINALGAPTSVYAWDNVNTLTVRLSVGSPPSSNTELNVLNGANAAVLYPSLEVIQFQNVTDNGDGTYTLSKLLRGRRGTDWAVNGHTSGEIVLFPLISGGLVHEQVSLSMLNLTRYYKAITVGADINSNATSQAVALKGRDLMPYSPADFTGTKSGGDFTLTWVRRTRLGGAWLDGTGHVPLNEDYESYDVEILNGLGAVVRTFADLRPPSGPDTWSSPSQPHVVYTAAQQTTDFGSPQSTIRARVYQNSAQVGRGFPAENDAIGA